MSAFEPTPEQQLVVEAARDTSNNLIVSALAGAAKTSTLVLIAEALPKTSMLCLAFNKRIAVEMQSRLPSTCVAMTLNSLGHRVWGQALGRRLVVNTKKNYEILSSLVEKLPPNEKEEAYATFADTLRAIEQGKTAGYVPTGKFSNAKRLLDDDDFFLALEEEPTRLQEDLIRAASFESIKQGYQGTIDFSDQILLPTVFAVSFPQYPIVLVDEAQDLSELNHATLRKLAKKRLIAVGDECQSIYAFRGAHQASMRLLQESFSMRKLILSVSFRCPKAVVEAARWRAPHMQYPEWAKDGEVRHLPSWTVEDLPNVATIICRNNAPIFSMAIQLLKNGRYPEIVGNDLGKNLIKTLKKFGSPGLSQDKVHDMIDAWEKEKKRKSRNEAKVADTADCLRIFADQGKNLGDAIAYAEHIMSAKGPIQMLTGHKAKGLEWDDVFVLDKHLVKVDRDEQEKNLLYVMITRAKSNLYYVESEGFEEVEREDVATA